MDESTQRHERLASLVVAYWRDVPFDEEGDETLRGVHREGASVEALAALERVAGVSLPAGFVALWSLSDGTSTMDRHEKIFWPVQVIETQLRESVTDPKEVWIPFADFRLGSALLLVCVDRKDGQARVFVDTYRSAESLAVRATQIAPSFSEFMERYLDDPAFWRPPGGSR